MIDSAVSNRRNRLAIDWNAENSRFFRPPTSPASDSQTAAAPATPHPQTRRWPRLRPSPAPESQSPSPQIRDSYASAAAQNANPAPPTPLERPPRDGFPPSAASYCPTVSLRHTARPPASFPQSQIPFPLRLDGTPSLRPTHCG